MPENKDVKKKKKIKKISKKSNKHALGLASFVLSLCFFAASAYFLYQTGREVYTMVSLKKEIKVSEDVLKVLQEETEILSSEKEKLEDPKYVKRYARGQYLLTKDGEKIFYLPSK